MKFNDSVCHAFNLVPSQLDALFYEVTYSDLKFKVRAFGERVVINHTQLWETLSIVATTALGGKRKSNKITTADDAISDFEGMFGGPGVVGT